MATLQNPSLRRSFAPADDAGGQPAVGGSPAMANPVAAMLSSASAPAILQPGEAAPDVNPLPSGTRTGAAVRSAVRTGVNAAFRAGTGFTNYLTSGPRAAGGFLRDAGRALVGAAASPNAGQAYAPTVAPQLKKPPVVFQTDAPGAGAAAAAGKPDPNYDPAADNISASNLAAASRFTAAPSLTKPIAAASTAGAPGALPYGAVVNGVPTFSDGSGDGSIPRTMSDEQIKALGSRVNLVDAKNFQQALASNADGSTPSSEQMIARAGNTLTRPITGSRPSTADFAASDRNAIASGDWRSAAGTAASNLRMDAQYAGSPQLRRAAADQLAGLTTGAQQSAALDQQGDQQSALAAQQNQGALDVENLRGRNALAQTGLEIQKAQLTREGHPITMADGTIALVDPITGQVTQSRQADGSPAKALVAKDDSATKRTNELVDQLDKGVQEQMKAYLPTKDAPTPTPEMISQWRQQQALAMNLPMATNKQTGERIVNVNGQWIPL